MTIELLEKLLKGKNQKETSSKRLSAGLFLAAIAGIGLLVLSSISKKKEIKNVAAEQPIKTAAEVLSQDKIWQEHFENKLKDSEISQKQANEKLLSSIEEKLDKISKTTNQDIDNLRFQIDKERRISQLDRQSRKTEQQVFEAPRQQNISISKIGASSDLPKDLSIYIPAGTYVPSRLLSGISVSTGIGVQADPMPVIIRVTANAVAPSGAKIALKECRIIGSCYGDLSSERAFLRLETLSCVQGKRAFETSIEGIVTGDDGLPGIKGKVISMDAQHLQNAFFGGFLSGLSKAATAQNENMPAMFMSAGGEKKHSSFKEFGSNLKDNAIGGFGNAADGIANYYIKKAESISPVIQVPSGALLDVVILKGVFFSTEIKRGANEK